MSGPDFNEPAFPQHAETGNMEGWRHGMALRDYFAAHALPAVIAAYVQSNGSCIGTDHILRNAPIIAFQFADAMLEKRRKS